ncbi:MAG TPA: adenylate/guanylate cyclase domain-containing protein [Gaiellaceae bacterium]|nr:adenylate/guanylate cyclase domain-containing protein [Gaiellaceae bacterium]
MALDIRYARSGGVSIAYQVVGEGDVDLLYVPDYVSNLVYGWETPYWRRFYEQLAERFRLILFDKRGTGLSDLGGQFPALETRMDDVRAVLDAVGSSTAVLLGSHDGCSMAALYAATYPERTRALVLFHPVAHDPTAQTEEARDELARLRETWGTQELADEILGEGSPSLAGDPAFRDWFTNWLRVGASPSVAYALNRAWYDTDLRDVLPSIRVPTLVLYRDVNAELSRDVADRIPGAKATRVSGTDDGELWLSPEIPDEVERFVAGEPVADVPDTVLSTVLFTDIVGSSAVAARLGDREWRQLLERHHALVRRELARYRGEEKDTVGDGFFATFDGPARAIRCAEAIVEGVRDLGLEVRAGVHTGECELHEGKVAGLAVVIGARVSALASAGEVLVSQTVKDLVAGAGLELAERGEHELKGVPGSWRLYAVAG